MAKTTSTSAATVPAVSSAAKELVKAVQQTRKNPAGTLGISPLATALMTTLEPLLFALDSNPNWVDDPQTDTGTERTSQNDVGLQIILSFTINNFHTQLYGPIITKKGQIDSIKDRLDTAEKAMRDHCEKYEQDPLAMSTDPRTYTLNRYFQVAEARFNTVKDLCDAFKAVYHHIFGEQWKQQNETNASAVRKVELTDKAKAEAEALMARFLKKSPQAPIAA